MSQHSPSQLSISTGGCDSEASGRHTHPHHGLGFSFGFHFKVFLRLHLEVTGHYTTVQRPCL